MRVWQAILSGLRATTLHIHGNNQRWVLSTRVPTPVLQLGVSGIPSAIPPTPAKQQHMLMHTACGGPAVGRDGGPAGGPIGGPAQGPLGGPASGPDGGPAGGTAGEPCAGLLAVCAGGVGPEASPGVPCGAWLCHALAHQPRCPTRQCCRSLNPHVISSDSRRKKK